MIIAAVTALVFFVFSFEIATQMYINYRANPPGIICDQLIDTYQADKVQYMAGIEYLYLNSTQSGYKDFTQRISQTGALPCFCEYEASQGKTPDTEYDFKFGNYT